MIFCTHGAKRHTHDSLPELQECIDFFHIAAHPRDVAVMVALGVPEFAAIHTPRQMVAPVIASRVAKISNKSRESTSAASQHRRTNTRLAF